MQNKLIDLNNHLFEQLERLNDEELSEDDMRKEIERSKAMASISNQIIENARLNLNATELALEYGENFKNLPPMLSYGKQ